MNALVLKSHPLIDLQTTLSRHQMRLMDVFTNCDDTDQLAE